jgi:hypothetical protein
MSTTKLSRLFCIDTNPAPTSSTGTTSSFLDNSKGEMTNVFAVTTVTNITYSSICDDCSVYTYTFTNYDIARNSLKHHAHYTYNSEFKEESVEKDGCYKKGNPEIDDQIEMGEDSCRLEPVTQNG